MAPDAVYRKRPYSGLSGRPLKTGLLEIAKIHKGEFRITANQNLIIAGVPESQKAKIEKLARDHGLMNAVNRSVKTRWPACRSRPVRWRWPKRNVSCRRLRQSGSDSGKTRHSGRAYRYARDRLPERLRPRDAGGVGLVGKAPGRYNLHLGGNRIGTRIPRMFRENITEPEILDSIDELVGRWAKEREAGEGFGDFTVRAGIIRPVLDPARDFWE
jgi:sulfite reductase (NADPH) hemoprotein beta-component